MNMDYNNIITDEYCKVYYQNKKYEKLILKVIDDLIKNKNENDDMQLVKGRLTPGEDGKKRNIEVYKNVFKSETFFIKNYYQRRLSKRIIRFFQGPQGLNNYKTGIKLQKEKIPCASPVACITYKNNFFDKDSISINKGINGNNLIDIFKNEDNNITPSDRMKISRKIGVLSAKLINNNYLHKDPHPENFICNKKNDDLKVFIIDFDSIYHLPFLPLSLVIHFLARINAKFFVWFVGNDINPPSDKERKEFIRAFFKLTKRKMKGKIFLKKVNKLTAKKILSRSDKSILKHYPKLKELVE